MAGESLLSSNCCVVHLASSTGNGYSAIKFQMDQKGLTVKDLEPMIDRSNRVYEVPNRIRPLTLPMIRSLHKGVFSS